MYDNYEYYSFNAWYIYLKYQQLFITIIYYFIILPFMTLLLFIVLLFMILVLINILLFTILLLFLVLLFMILVLFNILLLFIILLFMILLFYPTPQGQHQHLHSDQPAVISDHNSTKFQTCHIEEITVSPLQTHNVIIH